MLFINIWLYSHGIATQIISNGIDISLDIVKKLLTNAFMQFSIGILRKQRMKGINYDVKKSDKVTG